MKSLVIISETLMRDEILPKDPWVFEQFEFRSFVNFDELSILCQAGAIAAVIIDFEALEGQVDDHLKSIKSVSACNPSLPWIGVLPELLKSLDLNQFFDAGINHLLFEPINSAELQEAMEVLMGNRFRRLERKYIQVSLVLEASDQTWPVQARVINRECIVVEAKEVPPLNLNVFLSLADQEAFSLSFDCWAHTWKEVEGGVVLRFLSPQDSFLESIDQLPINVAEDSEDKVAPPPEVFLDPSVVDVIDLEKVLMQLKKYCLEGENCPLSWKGILERLEEKGMKALVNDDQVNQEVIRAVCFQMVLNEQTQGFAHTQVATDFDEARIQEIQKVFRDHERQAKKLNKTLQNLLTEALGAKDDEQVLRLNEIKSGIQKSLLSFQRRLSLFQMLDQKEEAPVIARPSLPKKKENRPKETKPQIASETRAPKLQKRVYALAILFFIMIGTLAMSYWKLTENQRKMDYLAEEKLQGISPYFTSVREFKESAGNTWRVQMNDKWQALSLEEKKQVLLELQQALQTHKVSFARFYAIKGGLVAVYNGRELKPLF